MLLDYKVIVGFIDGLAESTCERYDTIVSCIDVYITIPTEGGYTKEMIQVPKTEYRNLMDIGGMGAKLRATITKEKIVLESEDFILCQMCGCLLLFDEDLMDYEPCTKKTRGSGTYLSGQCYIVDEFIRYNPKSLEFCVGVSGRVYECFVSQNDACYTFLRSFYEYIRDGKFRNSFHFRAEVVGRSMLLKTLEFDNFV